MCNGLSTGSPDSPVPPDRLSDAQGTAAQRLVPSGTVEDTTGLSGVRLTTCQWSSAMVNRNDYVHRTVRCVAESSNFSPTTIFELGPIYTSPNRPFEGVGAQATYQYML
jgi:hypothetical protein